MLDKKKIPTPPTFPSLISLNGFYGRKAPCFSRLVYLVLDSRAKNHATASIAKAAWPSEAAGFTVAFSRTLVQRALSNCDWHIN